jgi:hypothetical protein
MARTPVTDDEIEEAVAEIEKQDRYDAPDEDRIKEILNEIQTVIEENRFKYRQMRAANDYPLNRLYETRKIMVMGNAGWTIDHEVEDLIVTDESQKVVQFVVKKAYKLAARRNNESEDNVTGNVIVFHKPYQCE